MILWAVGGFIAQAIASLFVPGGYVPIWASYAIRESRVGNKASAWIWAGMEWFFWWWRSGWTWSWGLSMVLFSLGIYCMHNQMARRGFFLWSGIVLLLFIELWLGATMESSELFPGFSWSLGLSFLLLLVWCLSPQRQRRRFYGMV